MILEFKKWSSKDCKNEKYRKNIEYKTKYYTK